MNTFFGLPVTANTQGGMTFALILAVLLGGLIGLERELHGHPAGLRTHILVSVGAALITLISVHLGTRLGVREDPGRIAAQIVSGIGFLGAGAIIREGASVRGLTTAASLWTTAGIGIAVGAGPFFGALAVIATALVLFTLWALHGVDIWIDRKGRRICPMEIQVRHAPGAVAEALGVLVERRIVIKGVSYETSRDNSVRQMTLRVRFPAGLDRSEVLRALAESAPVISVNMDEA